MLQLDVALALVRHKEQEKQEGFHLHLEDSVTSIVNHYSIQMARYRFFLLTDRCFKF